jgi:SPP1 family predicted phage head-tail adaptor
MRAGNLRNKVEIQESGSTQNEFNEVVEGDFTKFADAWASITPINGSEKFLSNADFSKVTHKIKIRYIAGINASMRIVWQNRVFNFMHTKNISERFKTIEILAWESNNV